MCKICGGILGHAPECPLFGEDYVIKCKGCGEELYHGDIYYPELEVCAHCIGQFREKVSEYDLTE